MLYLAIRSGAPASLFAVTKGMMMLMMTVMTMVNRRRAARDDEQERGREPVSERISELQEYVCLLVWKG